MDTSYVSSRYMGSLRRVVDASAHEVVGQLLLFDIALQPSMVRLRLGARRTALRSDARQRFRWAFRVVPRVLCRHPPSVIHEQRHRALRGLLRQRLLLLLRWSGAGCDRGGWQEPRQARHGGALQRQRLPVRVQGRRAGPGGCRDGAAQGPTLRGQVPASGRADHLVAVEFSREARNLAAFEVEGA